MSYTRRTFLRGSILVGSIGLAGCTGGPQTPTESRSDENNEDTDIEYEQCTKQFVALHNLPRPAKKEARAAIRNDVYETGELTLSEVISIDDSYLTRHGEDGYTYYKMSVTAADGVTRLHAEKIRPKTDLPTVDNQMKTDATVEIRVEFEGELVLEETLDIKAGTVIDLDKFDTNTVPRYGDYRATLTVSTEKESREKVLTWQMDHVHGTPAIVISTDSINIAQPIAGLIQCEWNNKGELVRGPGQH